MAGTVEIKRGFADLPHGQTHYRTAGSGAPLLAIHASPGSSRQLVRLIGDLAESATVYAPDTPGNGDSVALSANEPTIQDLAAAELRFMDAMGLDRVDLYGSHTGAAIAAELAILAPDRINKLVLDGVSWLTPEELEDILANYAFPFVPDQDGSYLIRLFQFCRDQYFFFPWYDRTRAGRRDGGLGSAQDLHAWVTEVMKASETYHLNYRAAFRYDAKQRFPLLSVPTLVIAAENDPLFGITEELAGFVPGGRFTGLPRLDAPDFASERKAAMTAFFAQTLTA
ncbi:MAG TPA: alpha/beta hydrolase [Sphingobium sp.]|uniref:alpha/beta fold hydrolase n=1 Tax=Sphingobium sp. TaxID=1912891 RepID=UPI002ED6B7A8